MSKESLIYVIVAAAVVIAVTAWVIWIARPAVGSYARWWERVAAGALSVYVLAVMLVLGAVGGGAFLYYFDQI